MYRIEVSDGRVAGALGNSFSYDGRPDLQQEMAYYDDSWEHSRAIIGSATVAQR